MKLLEFIIVTLCLPFYVMAWPLQRWGRNAATQKIRVLHCPSCGASLESVAPDDLLQCHVRLRIAVGAVVHWDRLPAWQVTCPSCSLDCCVDRRFRFTACDRSNAIERPATLSADRTD